MKVRISLEEHPAEDAKGWRTSEKMNRSYGDFDAAVRCQERANEIEKHGFYFAPIMQGHEY